MKNKEGYLEFISSESYKHQLDIWYKAYNISREKTELFHDFLISLYSLIEDTYLGPELFEEENVQKTHYTWCWDRTITNFEKEKIYFRDRGIHYEYFWNFYMEAFYYTKLDGKEVKIPDYLKKLFDFGHRKSRSELDILTEIYKLLDQNLKK